MTGRVRFLVVGTARSGTTLVQRLCCELPDVWVPPETHFWTLATDAAERFEFPLRGGNRAEMVGWLLDQLADRTLPVDASRVLEAIVERDARVGLWVVFEALVAAMSPAVSVLGEKTPNHVAHWEPLTDAVEDLKIVGVVRDPHAVLRSQRSVPWGEHDAWALAERWVAQQRSLEDAARLLGSERALVMRYEDLVADPESHQRLLAEFLGVPYQPEPLDPAVVARHPLFPAREVWKSNALGSVTTDHASGWDGSLSPEDVAIVDHVAGPTMRLHGYVPAEHTELPVMSRLSRDRVTAFRTWYAAAPAVGHLPIR